MRSLGGFRGPPFLGGGGAQFSSVQLEDYNPFRLLQIGYLESKSALMQAGSGGTGEAIPAAAVANEALRNLVPELLCLQRRWKWFARLC